MPISDFVEIERVGEGAYSSVFKVRRIADDKIYALKKVKIPKLTSKEKDNALNEVRLLASVKLVFIVYCIYSDTQILSHSKRLSLMNLHKHYGMIFF